MKANKIIRRLVEENIDQVDTCNKLLRQADERIERIHAQHRSEMECKQREVDAIRADYAELKQLKQQTDLSQLREKLTGE